MSFRKLNRRARPLRANAIQALEGRTLFAAGDLDLSFSEDGRATVGANFAVDMAVQSTGNSVVVGRGTSGQLAGKLVVARFNSAGALDGTFGGGDGLVITDYSEFGFATIHTAAVAIQPADDKIVVVGHVFVGNVPVLTITRFTADGFLDTTFGGGDGKVINAGTFAGFDVGVTASDVAIQTNGRIVVVGTVAPTDGGDDGVAMAFSRYLTDGTLDNSFSIDGEQVIGFGNNLNAIATKVKIDSSGRIVVVGDTYPPNNVNARQFAVMRLTPGGGLDLRLSVPFNGATTFSSGRDFVIQPDGKLVILGEVGELAGITRDFGLFRLNDNGTGDPSFGVGNGQIRFDIGGTDRVHSMIFGQTGKLLVGGSTSFGTVNGVALGLMSVACLSPNGQLDAAFGGGDAVAEIAFATGSSLPVAAAYGMALTPNGTFIAAGGANFATARLFDRRSRTISIGTFQPQMFEQGQQGTSFLIGLLEPQLTTTRVFIGTGGQATPPNTFPIRPRDYNGTGISFGDGQTSSTLVDIPAGSTFVNVVITPVDDATVEGDELATFGVAPNAAYDVAFPTNTTLVIRDNDVAVPSVSTSAFLFETGPQRLTFRFSQDVGASLSAADFQITGAAGIPAHTMAYDGVSNTATLSFADRLPDGNFTARIVAAGVSNAVGTAMAADHLFNFFFVNADATRDRKVDISDFSILASRFNFSGTFTQGDFNYDGVTAIGDFALLAGRFNTMIPTPSALPRQAAAGMLTSATNQGSVFASSFRGGAMIDLLDESLKSPAVAG